MPDPAGVALLRAERAEGPTPVMTAANIDDLVRFLITVLGYDLRATHGLPAIRLPFDGSSPAPGLTPVDLGAGWTGLRTDDNRIVDVAMTVTEQKSRSCGSPPLRPELSRDLGACFWCRHRSNASLPA